MNETAFAIGGFSFVFTIQCGLLWLQFSRMADNLSLINHNISKIVDIFEAEKLGETTRRVRR